MYSSTPIVSSKKRELPSPELLDEPKKNKLADSSVESVDTETLKFSYSEQLPMAQPKYKMAESMNVTLGDAHMSQIANVLKDSFTADMRDIIKAELSVMVKGITEGVLSGLNEKVQKLESDNVKLRSENAELKSRVEKLEGAVEQAEQYSRRNLLRMSGIPEDPNESTDSIVVEIATAISVDLDLSEIDRSHRVGKPRAGRPRDIIIKFSTYRARQKLYKSRTLLKDRGHRGVYINEDLTKHRNDLLYKARQCVKSHSIKSAWSHDGIILIKDNNDRVYKCLFQVLSQPIQDYCPFCGS